ncbi:hypothetical protein [Campylobacter blaseri]|nr:hypothetical protein [Campylobacter blaseri]
MLIFGNIVGYKLRLDGKDYTFFNAGELIQKEISESIVTLTLKIKT